MFPEKLSTLLSNFRWPVALALVGASLLGGGILLTKTDFFSSPKVEILETSETITSTEIVVEVAGEVEKPGVYKLPTGSRIEDALIAAGGVSASADRTWMEKSLNRAAKVIDGQKIYIPAKGESTQAIQGTAVNANTTGLININAASQKELESLPGIGPVYAANIIEGRPYSIIEDLKTKSIIPAKTYEKIQDQISVY